MWIPYTWISHLSQINQAFLVYIWSAAFLNGSIINVYKEEKFEFDLNVLKYLEYNWIIFLWVLKMLVINDYQFSKVIACHF